MSKYKYVASDYGPCNAPVFAYEPEDDFDFERLSEECAKDFYHDRDGWECDWPVTFELHRDDVHVGKYSVDMKREPVFSALKLKDKE